MRLVIVYIVLLLLLPSPAPFRASTLEKKVQVATKRATRGSYCHVNTSAPCYFARPLLNYESAKNDTVEMKI
ncbi:hypothetical protein EV127DRAFT_419161 [Xylaria flabelliformis]|nr:hypothetical protein EV127DRAFT_419161 [Xylaria flabelliformis]